jgi:hypothetical protein
VCSFVLVCSFLHWVVVWGFLVVVLLRLNAVSHIIRET